MEKKKGIISEFKEFISRGNVIDMAVGVVIGTAFKAIVDSLVGDLLTPILGLVLKRFNVEDIASWKIAGFGVGNFLNTVISFFIIAIGVFIMVKVINKAKSLSLVKKIENAEEAESEAEEVQPAENDSLEVLTEIRDLLKAQQDSRADKNI